MDYFCDDDADIDSGSEIVGDCDSVIEESIEDEIAIDDHEESTQEVSSSMGEMDNFEDESDHESDVSVYNTTKFYLTTLLLSLYIANRRRMVWVQICW